MNIQEAWQRHLTIHHRAGITLTLQPEQQVATMHLRMALEVCSDDEASIYLPRLARRLRLFPPSLSHELHNGMVWVAFDQTLSEVPAEEAADIAVFLRVPIGDGWQPGPAPLPVPYEGAPWQQAYETLKDEKDHCFWEIVQPGTRAIMKAHQQPVKQVGGSGEWGLHILAYDPYRYLGWHSLTNPGGIAAVLTESGLPLDGWFTVREAKRQFGLAVMQRAGII